LFVVFAGKKKNKTGRKNLRNSKQLSCLA